MAKILIVDDDVQMTTMMKEVFLEAGDQPTVINESSKTLEMADTVKPDAFVLDLMMPDPDGFKLCRMLRADPKFKDTPILIVTALGDTDSRIVAIGAGANDYLAKPFEIDELTSRIRKLLNSAK